MTPKITCVLFDLDGTLADTAPDLGGALNDLRVSLGLPPLADSILRPYASHGSKGLLEIGLQITPEHPEFTVLRKKFLDFYEARRDQNTVLFDGIVEMLNALTAAGLTWGIVTNKPKQFSGNVAARLGLAQDMGVLVSGDDAKFAKPAPDTLYLACQKMNISPQNCIYVGDAERDIQAANAAGMPVLAALWGYLGAESPVETWGATAFVEKPVDILRYLGIFKN